MPRLYAKSRIFVSSPDIELHSLIAESKADQPLGNLISNALFKDCLLFNLRKATCTASIFCKLKALSQLGIGKRPFALLVTPAIECLSTGTGKGPAPQEERETSVLQEVLEGQQWLNKTYGHISTYYSPCCESLANYIGSMI